MVITTFKPDHDLYNLQNFPLWFNQHGVTLDHLTLLFNKTELRHLGLEHRHRVALGRGDHAGAGDPGRLRAGPAALPRRRVADHRHLPDLSGADDAAVPAAGQGDLVPGPVRQAPVADPGLSDLHDPVLHLADGRLLQDDPVRDRGGGDGRRLLAPGRRRRGSSCRSAWPAC